MMIFELYSTIWELKQDNNKIELLMIIFVIHSQK
jgi:hypothetical protein